MSQKDTANSGVLSGFIALTLSIFLSCNAFSQDVDKVSDGFNYPVGSRNPGYVTEDPEDDGYYRRAEL